MKSERGLIMEVEIPVQLYEMLLNEAARTGSAIEEIVELCFRKFMERNRDDVNKCEKRYYRQD